MAGLYVCRHAILSYPLRAKDPFCRKVQRDLHVLSSLPVFLTQRGRRGLISLSQAPGRLPLPKSVWVALLFVAWARLGAALELTWPTGEARLVQNLWRGSCSHCSFAKQPPACKLQ